MKYPRESIYKEKRDILIHNSGRPSPPLLLVSGKHKAHVSGANHWTYEPGSKQRLHVVPQSTSREHVKGIAPHEGLTTSKECHPVA